MELRKPKPTGTTSESADALQHEVAMRVQNRIDADAAKQRRLVFRRTISRWCQILFLLSLCGGLFFAYRAGLVECWMSGDFSLPVSVVDNSDEPESQSIKEDVGQIKVERPNVDVGKIAERAEQLFVGASVDLWKNVAPQDSPSKNGAAKAFVALVPDANGGRTFWNVKFGGAAGFSAAKIGGAEISRAEFKRVVGKTPFLVVREGRAYVSTSGKSGGKSSVPAKGESFNPSRAHLGSLCDEIVRLKTQRPSFRYKVTLVLENFSRRVDVGSFGFGEEIPRDSFLSAARKLVDNAESCEILLSSATVEFSVESVSRR